MKFSARKSLSNRTRVGHHQVHAAALAAFAPMLRAKHPLPAEPKLTLSPSSAQSSAA